MTTIGTQAMEPKAPAPAYERFRSLLDGLIDAAVIVDKDLKPLAWNTAYMQTVGLRPRKFQKMAGEPGRRCRDLLELDVCDSSCLAAKVFKTQRSVRMDELSGASKVAEADQAEPSEDNQKKTLIVSAVPLHDHEGRVVAVLEVYRDVTAEARIQERYKYLLDQERRRAEILEEQVKERTAELSKSLEQLRATRAQLVQSEKLSSLGQLVAGIAHEINNPINFIYGNTDFLNTYVKQFMQLIDLLGELDLSAADKAKVAEAKSAIDYDYLVEDTGKLLVSIRNGAERATNIIRDLRAFIHGGAGEQRAPVNLTRCLETTLNLVQHEARGRINVERRYPEDLPQVLANESQLNQVFMNLIVNAIQAIRTKGTITLAIERRDKGLAVDVSDDGVGISEEQQLKVFDPFFTTKPVGQGTGLGLSISYSIVDAHGGRLSVKSQIGKGATFTVWLPESIIVTSGAPNS